jgi:hypothetical protein
MAMENRSSRAMMKKTRASYNAHPKFRSKRLQQGSPNSVMAPWMALMGDADSGLA